MDLKSQLNMDQLPQHVAIIMDGNGRWAKKHGKPRIFGHRNGVKAVREVTEAAAELGIKYLTLYAFSTENWRRPPLEVTALMQLLVETVRKELNTLNDNDIRLKAIGDLKRLPGKTHKALVEAMESTKKNQRMTLILALNYSARWEITKAMNHLLKDVISGEKNFDEIDESIFKQYLETRNFPDPELLIRTSGELRISNFLLWQIAYAELYFTELYWPDFRKDHLYEALLDFQKRERRFGKISEQLN